MITVFKKNQKIIATLPTGRVVEGVYIEPYGEDGHSFYVNELSGYGRDGEPKYKKAQYGVKEGFIKAKPRQTASTSEKQYKDWLKRKEVLENRIKEEEDNMCSTLTIGQEDKSKEKFMKKISRYREKLTEIEKKILEYIEENED